MGYLGSLSQDPLGRIFSKCAFLNLLSPLGLPLPSNALGSSKKLKIFPRGCVWIFFLLYGIVTSLLVQSNIIDKNYIQFQYPKTTTFEYVLHCGPTANRQTTEFTFVRRSISESPLKQNRSYDSCFKSLMWYGLIFDKNTRK